MKIMFDDKSYLNINKSNNNVIITIAAKDPKNSLKMIINSVEISLDQFKAISSAIEGL